MKNPLARWAWYEKTTGGNPNWPGPKPTPPAAAPSPKVDDESEEDLELAG